MNPDEYALDKLGVGSVISAGWIKRLDRSLKRRFDAMLIRRRWMLTPAEKAGQWLIEQGSAAAAVIEMELRDGQNRTDYVYPD